MNKRYSITLCILSLFMPPVHGLQLKNSAGSDTETAAQSAPTAGKPSMQLTLESILRHPSPDPATQISQERHQELLSDALAELCPERQTRSEVDSAVRAVIDETLTATEALVHKTYVRKGSAHKDLSGVFNTAHKRLSGILHEDSHEDRRHKAAYFLKAVEAQAKHRCARGVEQLRSRLRWIIASVSALIGASGVSFALVRRRNQQRARTAKAAKDKKLLLARKAQEAEEEKARKEQAAAEAAERRIKERKDRKALREQQNTVTAARRATEALAAQREEESDMVHDCFALMKVIGDNAPGVLYAAASKIQSLWRTASRHYQGNTQQYRVTRDGVILTAGLGTIYLMSAASLAALGALEELFNHRNDIGRSAAWATNKVYRRASRVVKAWVANQWQDGSKVAAVAGTTALVAVSVGGLWIVVPYTPSVISTLYSWGATTSSIAYGSWPLGLSEDPGFMARTLISLTKMAGIAGANACLNNRPDNTPVASWKDVGSLIKGAGSGLLSWTAQPLWTATRRLANMAGCGGTRAPRKKQNKK